MAARAPVFDSILNDYLSQVARLDNVARTSGALGVRHEKRGYRIGFFNQRFTISADRIVDEAGKAPHHSTSVILCQYLLLWSIIFRRTFCT